MLQPNLLFKGAYSFSKSQKSGIISTTHYLFKKIFLDNRQLLQVHWYMGDLISKKLNLQLQATGRNFKRRKIIFFFIKLFQRRKKHYMA